MNGQHKNKITPSRCCDRVSLANLLAETLDESAEQAVQHHIEQCESCRLTLQAMVAAEPEWADAQSQLRETEFHPIDSSDDPQATQDIQVNRILNLLGPTDDPKMLGRLGSYEISGLVGVGSTGYVLKAHEPRLNRFVAIKVLSPIYADHGPARSRFEREGKAVAAVADPHVVPIYGVDEYQGVPYIVMQYVAGGSLNDRIQKHGPLTTCEVARLGMQIAQGLAAAHAQGIVHRDVKPANVMLESTVDRAMVTDFGLARVVDDTTQTRSGVVAGTPQFMSPEQARGEIVEPASDLFSLGTVLYTACTGHSPFRAETVYGSIQRVCSEEPRPVRELNPDIAPWLVALIAKLQSKDRTLRFESANQVADILSDELAHLQNPAAVDQPSRDWMEPSTITKPSFLSSNWRILMTFSVPIMATLAFMFAPDFLFSPTLPPPEENSNGSAVTSAESSNESNQDDKKTSAKSDADKKSDKRNKSNRKKETESPKKQAINTVPAAGVVAAVNGSYTGGVVDGYGIYLPKSYDDSNASYPVLVFLQGGLGVGGEVDKVNGWGIPKLIKKRLIEEGTDESKTSFDRLVLDSFIVIAPHIQSGQFYTQESAIAEVIDEVLDTYRTDAKRVYLTGLSRGGAGTWGLASRIPERFAAIGPLAGGLGGVESYESLAKLPTWVAHNTGDNIFDYNETANAVLKIERISDSKFHRIVDETPSSEEYLNHKKVLALMEVDNHDAWNRIYQNEAFYRWLLKQKR